MQDALAVANLGVEVGKDNFSLELPLSYSPYLKFSDSMRLKLLSVQPEFRYWLSGCGSGHFLGVHGSLAAYNVSFPGTDRYQDPNVPAWGMGLSYGYALPLGKNSRWALDFNLGLGFIRYKTDIYDNTPIGIYLGSTEGFYWGPTKAGVGICYNFGSIKGGRSR